MHESIPRVSCSTNATTIVVCSLLCCELWLERVWNEPDQGWYDPTSVLKNLLAKSYHTHPRLDQCTRHHPVCSGCFIYKAKIQEQKHLIEACLKGLSEHTTTKTDGAGSKYLEIKIRVVCPQLDKSPFCFSHTHTIWKQSFCHRRLI